MVKKILFISGLDPSGNAGLIRDLEMLYFYFRKDLKASSVVTALTAQNKHAFLAPQIVTPQVFKNQLESVMPLSQFGAIKIGMLGNEKIIKVLINFFKKSKNLPPIVLDPVLCSTTGTSLLNRAGRKLLWEQLLPYVTLLTPNINEVSYFLKIKIQSQQDMEDAADILWVNSSVPVLIKGGHFIKSKQVSDLLMVDGKKQWLSYPRIQKETPRGTGCALSALIACQLAYGTSLKQSVIKARRLFQHWFKELAL